jgi:hypothetical protein
MLPKNNTATSLPHKYRNVLMIDVRDSYFQSDPFTFMQAPGSVSDGGKRHQFHVFNGVESFPIADCGWNSGWVKSCFGNTVLQDIGHKRIICSGVSVGTFDAVLKYLRIMNDIIVGTPQQAAPVAQFPSCERNGVDQGVHNVLVHTGALEHLQLKAWGQAESPVANMQARMASIECTNSPSATGKRKCTVKNKAGAQVAVVHQYDRFPDLQQYLFTEVRCAVSVMYMDFWRF